MAINIFPRLDVSGSARWTGLRKGHWSTRGLVLCEPFGQGSPASVAPITRVGSHAFATQASPLGIRFPEGAFAVLVSNSEPVLPTQRATVLVVRRCHDTSARNSALFGTNAGNGDRLLAHCPWSDGNVYWDFGGVSSPNRLSVAITKTTQIEAWAFVAGRNGSAIYRNGVQLAAQSTAITRPAAAGEFHLNNGMSVGSDGQDVHFFALLDAEWTPTQVAEWSVNPWLMFGSSRMDTSLPAAPVAGGKPTLYYAQQRGR